jgi:hypothetical protein
MGLWDWGIKKESVGAAFCGRPIWLHYLQHFAPSPHPFPAGAVSQSQAEGEAVGFQSFRMRVF